MTSSCWSGKLFREQVQLDTKFSGCLCVCGFTALQRHWNRPILDVSLILYCHFNTTFRQRSTSRSAVSYKTNNTKIRTTHGQHTLRQITQNPCSTYARPVLIHSRHKPNSPKTVQAIPKSTLTQGPACSKISYPKHLVPIHPQPNSNSPCMDSASLTLNLDLNQYKHQCKRKQPREQAHATTYHLSELNVAR